MKSECRSGGTLDGCAPNGWGRLLANAAACALVCLATLLMATPAWSQEQHTDLTNQSLEDLMNVRVTSVAKKEQKLSQTASAIFVITSEDIRRSGATNIPDLLRMVPGMDVAQINGNAWAISARGLNDRFSNELLVMMDGRSVYTQTFGGVLWDVLDVPLEDIERIEVIRGPGGSVWGANAVNGIINIIRKKASDTRGGMIVGGGGNLEQGFGTVQYGGSVGSNTDYRIYTKYLNQSSMTSLSGRNGGDGWHLLRGGFRTDSKLSTKDTLTIQGDIYSGQEGNPTTFLAMITSPEPQANVGQTPLSGGYLQGIWNHVESPHADTTLQVSYDRYKRDDSLRETRTTFAADFQSHIGWGARHDVVWGASYRFSASETNGSLAFSLIPPNGSTQILGAFIQDEITVVPNRVFLTLGTKLEHDYYSGINLAPSARIAWTMSDRQMLWAAISHADRIPAATDTSVRLNLGGFTAPDGTPTAISIFGNRNFKDEELIATEMGYRTAPLDNLWIDFAAYYNDYYKQQTVEPLAPFFENTPSPPHEVMPFTYENLMHGEAHGFELAVNWKAKNPWTLSSGYSFERIHMHLKPTSQDVGSIVDAEGKTPHNSINFRSHLDLSHRFSLDASAYFVGGLGAEQVPSYTRLDTGLTWQRNEKFSISLVGQNLLKNRHIEFEDSAQDAESTQLKRSAYARLSWRF